MSAPTSRPPTTGAPTIEDFVGTALAVEPRFAADGRIAYLSNRDTPPHAWLYDPQAPTPVDLTPWAGVVYDHAFRPGHTQLLVVTDVGGDEQHQLHLVDIDTGTSTCLAGEAGVINGFGAWSPDGRWLAHISNRRDRRYFDLYIQDLDTQQSRLVLQHDGMNGISRFTADGRGLLFTRPNLDRPGDNDLFRLPLDPSGAAAGPPVHLSAHGEPASWTAVHAYASGTVLALSDEGHEFVGLQRIDGASGERRYLASFDWDIEAARSNAAGDHIALVLNEDGYSTLRAFALTADGELGEALHLPPVPPGVVNGLAWHAHGTALVFAFEGASISPGLCMARVGAAGDPPPLEWLTETRRGIEAGRLPEPSLVRYPSFDGTTVPAFFYRPQHPAPAGGWPCLILVHGGPESQSRPPLWKRYAGPLALLDRGVALLVPNVRGSTGYGKAYEHADDREKRMDAVADLVAAGDWLAATGEIDGRRIGLMGPSYGGFMVLAAAAEAPERWAAVIDLYGVVNFETLLAHTGVWRRRHRAREYGDDPELLRRLSPIHRAGQIRAPLLVVQGDRDVRVPQEESEQIVAAVRANGGPVDYRVYPDEGHGIEQPAHRLDLAARIVAFCETHLGPPTGHAAEETQI